MSINVGDKIWRPTSLRGGLLYEIGSPEWDKGSHGDPLIRAEQSLMRRNPDRLIWVAGAYLGLTCISKSAIPEAWTCLSVTKIGKDEKYVFVEAKEEPIWKLLEAYNIALELWHHVSIGKLEDTRAGKDFLALKEIAKVSHDRSVKHLIKETLSSYADDPTVREFEMRGYRSEILKINERIKKFNGRFAAPVRDSILAEIGNWSRCMGLTAEQAIDQLGIRSSVYSS